MIGMALQSKSTQLGGGYWVLTEHVSNSCGEWVEYRLFKGEYNLAWCTKPRDQDGRAEVWWRNDKAKAYQEYLQSGFVRYPFV